jgi:flagellar biosynthesis GTPase FlhF
VNGWGVRVIALMAVVGSYWIVYQHGRSVERAEAATASAQRDSGDRLAEVLGERGERQEEHRRAAAHEEVRAHAQEQRTIAEGAAAGADAAGQRLHDEAGKLAAAVSCPSTDPAVASRSKAATRAAMVLSELLDRSVETNRELAAAFDRARVAGLACEASYAVLRGGP